MLLQQFLVELIEPEGTDDSDCGGICDQNREPQVCEMYVVGLFAVGAGSKGSCGGNPYDDTGRYELKHAVPNTLKKVRWDPIVLMIG
jgi:hypothetical protein